MGIDNIIIGNDKENIQLCLDEIKKSVELTPHINECLLETFIDYRYEAIIINFKIKMAIPNKEKSNNG